MGIIFNLHSSYHVIFSLCMNFRQIMTSLQKICTVTIGNGVYCCLMKTDPGKRKCILVVLLHCKVAHSTVDLMRDIQPLAVNTSFNKERVEFITRLKISFNDFELVN